MAEADANVMMADHEFGTVVMNGTDFPDDVVMGSLTQQHPEMASMIRWSQDTHRRANGGLFERDRYVTPSRVFDQMRVAQDALETDDACSGVLESTEALAFNKMSIETYDEDEEDIWNQIIGDLELDARMREMWRELFSVSQFYAFVWWGTKSYTVGGRTKGGVRRKKQFLNLQVPLGITLLDPLKVIPVGNLLFNQEKLAFIATREESINIEPALPGLANGVAAGGDDVIANMFTGKYNPGPVERRQLANLGADPNFMYLLNPENCFRHTETRPQYKRFADVRMKSVFEILDLKHQLREMDRAHLLGGTNFIVLIRKGSDNLPANQTELDNLQAGMRTMARLPVIVGDHRLSVEIITPKMDQTLQPDRYNGLDARITARLFQMFLTGNFAAGAKGDDSIKLARVVARGLESRRYMLMLALQKHILKPIYEKNEQFIDPPNLAFHPKQIALDFDPGLAQYFMDLRDRHEISRDTLLSQVDVSEVDEARKLEREHETFDDTFHSISALNDPQQTSDLAMKQAKFNTDLQMKMAEHQVAIQPIVPGADTTTTKPKNDPKAAGRARGGNHNGGGSAPGSGQGQPPRTGKAKGT